jgi:hypothetical protein
VPFSDVIGKKRKEIGLWKLSLKRKQGRHMDTRKIRRLMHTVQQPRALQMPMTELLQAQTACERRYKTSKLNSAALRKEFETKVNLNRALKYGTSVTTQEKITKNAFQSKSTHSRIRNVINQNTRAAIT